MTILWIYLKLMYNAQNAIQFFLIVLNVIKINVYYAKIHFIEILRIMQFVENALIVVIHVFIVLFV